MSKEQEKYYDLAQRIDDALSQIDSDICVDLRNNDSEYKAWRHEHIELTSKYPFIETMTEGVEPVSLNTDEIAALTRSAVLKRKMILAELRATYYRGHADCFAYLKQIGVI